MLFNAFRNNECLVLVPTDADTLSEKVADGAYIGRAGNTIIEYPFSAETMQHTPLVPFIGKVADDILFEENFTALHGYVEAKPGTEEATNQGKRL